MNWRLTKLELAVECAIREDSCTAWVHCCYCHTNNDATFCEGHVNNLNLRIGRSEFDLECSDECISLISNGHVEIYIISDIQLYDLTLGNSEEVRVNS